MAFAGCEHHRAANNPAALTPSCSLFNLLLSLFLIITETRRLPLGTFGDVASA